ncbi:ubiquitin domain-containing protein UBFD1 [Trichonephila inaurata madagascariensis]|uniref:Ubiquitin domain-containing protein UBFD1 n=1 Tax=Trichonephila inaurata madagascariensis TaxID=2747483 RepID=A0A8X7C0R9_9ARAC|nr:ubiquitin domain-containing protein UBFD1 [Trichonephila inaurata madagascariensis]
MCVVLLSDNKQSRGNSNRNNSYRGNQRFNRYPKPNEQRFNRFKNRDGYYPEIFDVEERYTEGDYLPQNKADSEDCFVEACHDTSTVTDLSPRSRSYIPSNKRNERTNITIQTENMMGKRKGISITDLIHIPEGEGMGLILMKSTIIKIKIINMLEHKIMTVK